MPICPFCDLLVSTSPRGYILKHRYALHGQICYGSGLSVEGAKQYLAVMGQRGQQLQKQSQGVDSMGMFDKPQYLTGKDEGYVQPGETFWLHNARLDGQSTVGGETRDQAKLLVSRTRDGEQVAVWTGGRGIVGQVARMDNADRERMPFEVRLDQIPSGRGNPTNVLTPASEPAPERIADADIPF